MKRSGSTQLSGAKLEPTALCCPGKRLNPVTDRLERLASTRRASRFSGGVDPSTHATSDSAPAASASCGLGLDPSWFRPHGFSFLLLNEMRPRELQRRDLLVEVLNRSV
jgi:hypothetical protein